MAKNKNSNTMTVSEFRKWAKKKKITLINKYKGFKTGDIVIFTNDYGVKFELQIKGFDKEEIEKGSKRVVYIFDDAYWFPSKIEQIKLKNNNPMATKKKPGKRISVKTMCRKTIGTPGINKRTGQLLKGWKYVNGIPVKVTKTKKRGLGATCVRSNSDGSSTTYTSHGGMNPCPHGGRIRAERVSTLTPASTTYGLGKAKPKRKATKKQSAAQKAFAINARKAAALVKSGKARNIKAAWKMLK